MDQLKLKLIVAKRTDFSDNIVDDVSPIKVQMSDGLTRLNKTQAPNDATVQVFSGL